MVWEDWERKRIDGALAVVSTIDPNGMPHAVPVKVWLEGDALRIETAHDSRKLRNLIRDPRVALCVFGAPKWGVSIQGTAEVLSSGDGSGQAQVRIVADRKVSWRRKEAGLNR
ncbi:MAG: pyridoxamine 5'-phosphate oxidase family protein [Actinomycetota bacterium]